MLGDDERMYVYLRSSHFQQNNASTSNSDRVISNNVINIYYCLQIRSNIVKQRYIIYCSKCFIRCDVNYYKY